MKYVYIKEMSDAVIAMVTESIDSYVSQDAVLARKVIAADDQVDTYFVKIKEDLIRRLASQPEKGELCLDLLMVAKYLERIGDHATNIAEWVLYAITGHHEGEE